MTRSRKYCCRALTTSLNSFTSAGPDSSTSFVVKIEFKDTTCVTQPVDVNEGEKNDEKEDEEDRDSVDGFSNGVRRTRIDNR